MSLLKLLELTILVLLLHDRSLAHMVSTPYDSQMIMDNAPATHRRGHAPLDTTHYSTPPQGLALQQVHVFVRHGERTPVGVRLAGPPGNVPEQWTMCKAAREFQAAVAEHHNSNKTVGDNWLRARKLVERADGTVIDGECLLGELTDLGRQSTYGFGRYLRQLYIEKMGFLEDNLTREEEVYFRSTNVPRTIESLQQVIHGLYPTSKCDSNVTPPLLIRNGRDENLLGNTLSCKRLEVLQLGFAQAAAASYNQLLEPLDEKISKYLNGNPIRVDGKPRASGILDTVRSAIAHGVKVPPEFEDKKVIDPIEKAVVNEWFSGYKTEEVRRLGMGRLLGDVSRKMQHKVDFSDKDPLKILVHATHDTTIAALCSTFDVFNNRWPDFTASITFELFKGKTLESRNSLLHSIVSLFRPMPETQQYYVRMRFQNKDMALPICAEKGKHLPGSPEFCTLAAFRERVKELTPVDWDAECASGPKANS